MTKKEKFIQILKFTLFSASAAIIQFASFELVALFCRSVLSLVEEQYYWYVYVLSLFLSVVWNFTFNRKFTFKSSNNVPKAMALVLLFYAVFTPLSTCFGNALVKIGWDDTLVLVINMLLNFVTEFLYDDLVVFRKKKEQKQEIADECENNSSDNK